MINIGFLGTVDGVKVERVNHLAVISLDNIQLSVCGHIRSFSSVGRCKSSRAARVKIKKAYNWSDKKHGSFNA